MYRLVNSVRVSAGEASQFQKAEIDSWAKSIPSSIHKVLLHGWQFNAHVLTLSSSSTLLTCNLVSEVNEFTRKRHPELMTKGCEPGMTSVVSQQLARWFMKQTSPILVSVNKSLTV